MTSVSERYASYKAPRWVLPALECLLGTLPKGHIQDLSSVVLTDSDGVGDGKTGRVRGRKHARRACRGFYHRASKGVPAWIELVVDNTIRSIPQSALLIPGMRELVLGEVLYHEVGHHFDATVGAPARSGESAAEAWSARLLRQHIRQRHHVRRAVGYVMAPAVRVIVSHLRRRAHVQRRGAAG